ncbi:response regulator [Rubrivirga litoralis]|uniref:Response regulator transcription factor n=1 Tax=Rubrivirga litoralis TaxID=3075598 RepID=A0ABU3BSG5_9BACT|nr:response regulator transcription factor [Rubrivirga sp. F394]MDT0632231.1 response regulator transcription factor [Rubrivirga sp. F394]
MTAPAVLLVDDDATFLQHAARFLGQGGAVRVVGTARSADEGVALAQSVRPDVVVLDLSMPDTDGFAALPIFRAAAPGAAVVVVTTHEGSHYRTRALALGAAGFVPKRRLVDDLLPEIVRLCPPLPRAAPAPPALGTAPPARPA